MIMLWLWASHLLDFGARNSSSHNSRVISCGEEGHQFHLEAYAKAISSGRLVKALL